jgi:hypothetical protein
MSTIAILREANKGGGLHKSGKPSKNQVSTLEHILNKQEHNNNDINKNPNKNNENVLIEFDSEKNQFISQKFRRDGNNKDLIDKFINLEKNLHEEAKKDYKEHKLNERAENKASGIKKKVRTELQSKDLKREMIIALGGDQKINSKKDFEEKILKTARELMRAKGLEDKNILSISIHYDEKTPHAHIQYNEYSFIHKTTSTEYNKVRFVEGATPHEINKLNREKFGTLQDIVAENMEMARGVKNSKAIHKEKYEFYQDAIKNDPNLLKLQSVIMTKIKNEELEKELSEVKKELEETNINYVDKCAELSALENKINIMEGLIEKSDKKTNEMTELFTALGLDEIKSYMKKEDYKKVLEKTEIKSLTTQIVDTFKMLFAEMIRNNINDQLTAFKKTSEVNKEINNNELLNNVNKTIKLNKNKDQIDI